MSRDAQSNLIGQVMERLRAPAVDKRGGVTQRLKEQTFPRACLQPPKCYAESFSAGEMSKRSQGGGQLGSAEVSCRKSEHVGEGQPQ